ncbi:MAG: hypothetical protein KIT45_05650 [Fimbriimonadia bacterium]|nr:hypothetical protein [Fimbriimonadia bacterium]
MDLIMKLFILILSFWALLPFAAAQEWVMDTLHGRGAEGPYTLRWSKIAGGSESVFVNEQWLKRGADYTFDAQNGRITFKNPLAYGQAVRVSYQVLKGSSARNVDRADVPLQMDLLHIGGAELGLMGRVTGTDRESERILGLYGKWGSHRAGLEGTYLMNSPDDNAPDLFRLAGNWQSGAVRASASYSRADEEFSQARAFNAQSGQEIYQVGLDWRPSDRWKGSVGWSQASSTSEIDWLRQRWQAALGYSQRQFSLNAERSVLSETDRPELVTDRFSLQANPLRDARVKVEHTQQVAGEADPLNKTQISAQATGRIAQANVTHKMESQGANEQQQTQLGLQARYGIFSSSAQVDQHVQNEATQRSAQMRFGASLDPRLEVGGEIKAREDAGQMRGYDVTARPLETLQIRAQRRHYEGLFDSHETAQRYEWQWSLLPNLQLSGNFADRAEDAQGRPSNRQRHAHDVAWQWEGWQVRAGFGEARQIGQDNRERNLTFGLQRQLDPATLFRVDYRQTDWLSSSLVRERLIRLGFTRSLGWFDFSLDATATLPRIDSPDPNRPRYGGSAKLGVRF